MGSHTHRMLRSGVPIPPPEPIQPVDGKPARAWGYMRVSTQEQFRSGLSLGEQARQITMYCNNMILDLGPTVRSDRERGVEEWPERLCEEAASAYKRRFSLRPVGGFMCENMLRGDHIVIAKTDRAFRNGLDAAQQVETWAARGVTVHLLDIPGQNVSVFPGKLMLVMAAYFAEWESFRRSERIADAKAQARRRKRPSVTSPPLGYHWHYTFGNKHLVPHWEEVRSARTIFLLHQEGMNNEAIYFELLRRRIKRPDKRKPGSKLRFTGEWTVDQIKVAIEYWYTLCCIMATQNCGVRKAVDVWLDRYADFNLPTANEIQEAIEGYRLRSGHPITYLASQEVEA